MVFQEYQAQLDVDLAVQDSEHEVRDLPGVYAPPSGRLLLATHRAQPVGIVAIRGGGYEEIVLDTLPSMQPAQRLNEHFGFSDIAAYRASPVPGTRYLALALGAT